MYPNTFYRVSVKALIKDDSGKVLVLKENQNTWSLPGGGLDHGEDAEDGIRRELKEELGIQDSIINGITQVCTFELKDKRAWLLWIVYDVSISTTTFKPGDGVSDSQFIDPETLRFSEDIFEKHVYEAAIASRMH